MKTDQKPKTKNQKPKTKNQQQKAKSQTKAKSHPLCQSVSRSVGLTSTDLPSHALSSE